MRYCCNDDCERRNSCIRYVLGKDYRPDRPSSHGWMRSKMAGVWVGYRNKIEARSCTQYVEANGWERRAPRAMHV